MKITRTIYIEDLVREVPASVRYLRENGVKCLECGEPVWGTLEEAARVKGFTDEDIDRLVDELNQISADRG
jgi:methionine synthase II (cobalamin-independent)